jgi:hypothetical protein
VIDGQSITFPFEQLDGIASAAEENEHAAPFNLCIHKPIHEATESIEAGCFFRKSAGPWNQKYCVSVSISSMVSPISILESGRWSDACKEKDLHATGFCNDDTITHYFFWFLQRNRNEASRCWIKFNMFFEPG